MSPTPAEPPTEPPAVPPVVPPVGIVLVSHSAAVATAVAELARGLAGGGDLAPLLPAGGTADGGLGTSSELICEAAKAVDRGPVWRSWSTWAARSSP